MVPFYEALGFRVTYRQAKPNPYLCLARAAVDIHFFGLASFDPNDSMGSIVWLVPDTLTLHRAFSNGLRARFGRVPLSGIPRMTRPRRKQGAGGGFTVVDPGGNWLRISSPSDEADDVGPSSQLDLVLRAAARQGDAHGDPTRAISMLDAGLLRHADMSPADRLTALVYLAELLVRVGDQQRARATLALIANLDLDTRARTAASAQLAAAAELAEALDGPSTTP